MSSNWRVSAATSVGGLHQLDGFKPNQDYAIAKQLPDGFCLAVADGHGSSAYDRSDEGARFACEVGLSALLQIAAQARLGQDVQDLDKVCRWIVSQWQARCDERSREYLRRSDLRSTKTQDTNQWRRYGSTLMLVLVVKEDVWSFQIGDGSIVLVSDSGGIMPLGSEEKWGSATNSLCNQDARRVMRAQRITVPGLLWAAALTDGVADQMDEEQTILWAQEAFEDAQELSHAVFVQNMAKKTLEAAWLDGDDSTIAYAWRKL